MLSLTALDFGAQVRGRGGGREGPLSGRPCGERGPWRERGGLLFGFTAPPPPTKPSARPQLKALRSTDVLIGVHGAGLVLQNFLADGAATIELFDVVRGGGAYGRQHLAKGGRGDAPPPLSPS